MTNYLGTLAACCHWEPPKYTERIICFEGTFSDVRPDIVNNGRLPNKIATTRFTLLTWLPKSLFVQFQRVANLYFLLVSILVCLPFSPVMWSSTAVPFAAVLLWTALKDLYEDRKRQRDDDTVNYKKCWRFDFHQQTFVEITWQQVLCGDIILSFKGDEFPADLVIMGSENGQAFVSTVTLDGETNLKERIPPSTCSAATAVEVTVAESADIRDTRVEVNPESVSDIILAKEPADVLKRIQTIQEADSLVKSLILQQRLEARFDAPQASLEKVGGSVILRSPSEQAKKSLAYFKVSDTCRIGAENFVARGCRLQQTAWLVSIVAYAGPETKPCLNMAQSASKTSNLQVALNRCVLGLVVCLGVFCIYAAILGQEIGVDKTPVDFVKRVIVYWIILYQVVPVSLYVVFEMVKLLLGLRINRDEQMAITQDDGTKVYALARTADLVEELGQVEHIFSDKTGTLTQNEMRFARCYIGGKDLGEFRPAEDCPSPNSSCASSVLGRGGKPLPAGIREANRIMLDANDPLSKDTLDFFHCLAVCHDIQVEIKGGTPLYSGSSADEVAFLDAAHQAGMSLRSRKALSGSTGRLLELLRPDGSTTLVEVLCEIPFNSDRKRMSVVCKLDGQYICMTKGADMVMLPLCCMPSGSSLNLQHQLKEYAKEGLRTLVISLKVLDTAFFEKWHADYKAARSADGDQRDRLMETCAKEVEHSLRLCGLTAIEDRLQDGVPQAIYMLRKMGIHIWMLTGDKTETAIEIANSCNLVDSNAPLIKLIDAQNQEEAIFMLEEANQQHLKNHDAGVQAGLVIDGAFLHFLARLDAELKQSKDSSMGGIYAMLCEVALASSACICCRLSPKQKRDLVELVKFRSGGRITLAIGDGANDVPMIQGAHVGIAVRGREGTQAVQASDVTISQFRFLLPLLQCHGRRAYRRVSLYLCYFIYKHVALAVGDVLWAHVNKFQGNIAYPEWLSSGYPIVFTALPIVVIIVLDRDVPDKDAVRMPELYAEGQKRIHFNLWIFTTWMASGVLHGSLAWLVPYYWMSIDSTTAKQAGSSFWVASVVSFSLVMSHVSLRLWIVSMNPFASFTLLVLLFSIVVYIIAVAVLGQSPLGLYMQPQMENVPANLFTNVKAVLSLVITPLSLFMDVLIFKLAKYVRPTPLDLARKGRVSPS